MKIPRIFTRKNHEVVIEEQEKQDVLAPDYEPHDRDINIWLKEDEEANADSTSTTVRQPVRLSESEKQYIERTIFLDLENRHCTERNALIETIRKGVEGIDGNKRDRGTIKYYIYDSTERRKSKNRPYKMVFGPHTYRQDFKQRMLQEISRLGTQEVKERFGLPSSTLDGWTHGKGIKNEAEAPPKETESSTVEEERFEPKGYRPVTTPKPDTDPTAEVTQEAEVKQRADELVKTIYPLVDHLGEIQVTNTAFKKEVIAELDENIKNQMELKESEKALKTLVENSIDMERYVNTTLNNLTKIDAQLPPEVKTAMAERQKKIVGLRKRSGEASAKKFQIDKALGDVIKSIRPITKKR